MSPVDVYVGLQLRAADRLDRRAQLAAIWSPAVAAEYRFAAKGIRALIAHLLAPQGRGRR